MSFSEFIESNIKELLRTWEEFARKAQPDGADLDRRELRDWADKLLLAIAREMESSQSDAELEHKARRLRPTCDPALARAAQVHAMERLAQGFNINQMVSEYRAIRTSAALLWQQQVTPDKNSLKQLIRFDEAMDQALAESVRRYASALERARDMFVAALGHDMRTPLGSILVTVDAVLMQADALESSHLQAAVRIRNAAQRINDMLQDLVDFTQTRLGGRLPITRREADVKELLTRIAEEMRATNPDREFVLDCDSNLTEQLDPDRVGQMVANLLSNACRYGDPHSPIRVSARQSTEETVISVHNEGDPIPDELHRKIFEPLVRGHAGEPGAGRTKDRGLGLGLYIARQIAESHGGELVLKCGKTGGTTFTARLPRSTDNSG